jgi:hypothetical protein
VTRYLLAGTILIAISLTACPRSTPAPSSSSPAARPDRKDRALTAQQQGFLDRLADRAAANPDDFAAQKAAGMAYMQFTLSGVLSLQAQAETYLEAAFAIDPTDRELTRSLGRFYNMRAVDGDYSKADMQVKVYAAHLGDQDPRQMSSSDFVAHSFYKLGEILTLKNRGNLLGALGTIKDFEGVLRERTERDPNDIEIFALAGNFAFFFAGNVPMGKTDRVRAAVGYFEVLRARWDELREGARDETHCPNTYENFMFELAEGYVVLERPEDARPIYEELASVRGTVTRAKEEIAFVSRERLRNMDAYLGDMDLMPPWPGDVANCVVCHSWTADVSVRSLHAVSPIRLEDIPTSATAKPVP